MKLCKDCRFNQASLCYRRNEYLSPVTGKMEFHNYSSPSCVIEREKLGFCDVFFCNRIDKCGPEGKYYENLMEV